MFRLTCRNNAKTLRRYTKMLKEITHLLAFQIFRIIIFSLYIIKYFYKFSKNGLKTQVYFLCFTGALSDYYPKTL